MPYLKSRITLLLPGGLTVLAALLIFRPGVLPDSTWPYGDAYPYVVFGLGAALGWYFNCGRVVLALAILGATNGILVGGGIGQGVARNGGRAAFDLLCVLLPVNFAGYAIVAERGVLTARGLRRVVPILLQGLAGGLLLLLARRGLAGWLEYRFIEPRLTSWTAVPQAALATFGAAAIFLAVRCVLSGSAIDAGLLWALLSTYVALHGIRLGWAPAPFLAAGGLALIVALVVTSYRMAYHDELTGLPGRRALNDALLPLGRRYAVAMVDVDRFKRFNDTYGHEVGDQVLRMVASKLSAITGGGKAFRYGGEEFSVIFPGKSADEAVSHLEELRKAIEASRFVLRGPGRPRKKPPAPTPRSAPRKEVAVTVSIGVADRDGRRSDPQQVIRAADRALYRAKNAGRNRVVG